MTSSSSVAPSPAAPSPPPPFVGAVCADAGKDWMEQHFEAIGRHSTVNIRRDYLDDTRMALPYPSHIGPRSVGRGFRPWLARMLGQARG